MHFADRLTERAREIGSAVCVGIDPRWGMLPEDVRRQALKSARDPGTAAAAAYGALAAGVIARTAPYACAVKVQAAFFESAGPGGWPAFDGVMRMASGMGIPVIADAKRGDIGSTSEAYAQAFFGGLMVDEREVPGPGADAVTVNPYFGTDGVQPFLDACDERERGVFILVRTSNPSAAELQDLAVETPEGGREPLYRRVAALVRKWGEGRTGEGGWSSVGAVAGATSPETLAEIREILPRSILLVPGYGAQGAGPDEVARAFDDRGEGAIVNASRSIVFARRDAATLKELADAAAEAAKRMRDEIGEAIGRLHR